MSDNDTPVFKFKVVKVLRRENEKRLYQLWYGPKLISGMDEDDIIDLYQSMTDVVPSQVLEEDDPLVKREEQDRRESVDLETPYRKRGI
jgi:hypothetical protein